MSVKRASGPGTYSFVAKDSSPPPSGERELAPEDSADAFKIVVTLREALEAADNVRSRIDGTSDQRYASFLAKARERHLQIAENARHLLIDMIVTTSGEPRVTKRPRLALERGMG
jgi:hypothetical protein